MGFFEMNTVIKIAMIVATWWIGSKIGTAWELVSKIHMYINVSKKDVNTLTAACIGESCPVYSISILPWLRWILF